MSRAEIEDFTRAAIEAAAAPEDLATLEPADEDKLVRRRYIEGLTVHLGMLELKVIADPVSYWVSSGYNPESLPLANFPPLQVTCCSHETPKDLGEVTGMENDQAHAFKNHSAIDSVDYCVAHLVVSHVTPPNENISTVKDLLA